MSFSLDVTQLERAYHTLLEKVHPDKHVNSSDSDKRLAMQWALAANDAFKTLKDPQARAIYLCALHGVNVQENIALPIDFLMQQMQWREALEAASSQHDGTQLNILLDEVSKEYRTNIAKVGSILDAQDFSEAAQTLRQLLFLDRFIKELESAQAALDN